jgi:hypothetical protein
MGLFTTLIRKRQSQVDRVFRDRLAAFDSMSARDRADIGMNQGQIKKTARQMSRN